MMEVFSLQYSNSEGISASANEKLREVFYEDGVGFFGGVLEDALGDLEKWETVLESDSPEVWLRGRRKLQVWKMDAGYRRG